MDTTSALSDSPLLPSDDAGSEVFRWREEQFRGLGFSSSRAAELAFSAADLGQARYLLGSGCTLELALQILR